MKERISTIIVLLLMGMLFTCLNNAQIVTKKPDKVVIEQQNLGKSADLRPVISNLGLAIKNQDGRNTCSVFAVTFLLEFAAAKERGIQGADFSEEYLNAVTNMAKGTNDDGDFFENIALGYNLYGDVNEVDFPYQNDFNPNLLPSIQLQQKGKQNRYIKLSMIRPNDSTWGLTDAQIDSMLKSLDAGIPISAGFKVTNENNLELKKYGNITMWYALKDPNSFGGHSMPIVGYRSASIIPGGGYFIVRNSGGADWGDKGYGYVSFEYARKNIADVIIANPKSPLAGMILKPPMLVKRTVIPPLPIDVLNKAGRIFRQ